MLSTSSIYKTERFATIVQDDVIRERYKEMIGLTYINGIIVDVELINRGNFYSCAKSTYFATSHIRVTTVSIPKNTTLLCRLEAINTEVYQVEMKSYTFVPVNAPIENTTKYSDEIFQKKLEITSSKTIIVITDMEIGETDTSILNSLREGSLVNIQIIEMFKFIGETVIPAAAKIMHKQMPVYVTCDNYPVLERIDAKIWEKTSYLFHEEGIITPVDGEPCGITPMGYVKCAGVSVKVDPQFISDRHQNWVELCHFNAMVPSDISKRIMEI